MEGRLQCTNVIQESPFEECSFSVPQRLVRVPFVRIGASGVPGDGQSTWNLVFHQRIWGSSGLADTFMVRLPGHDPSNADWEYEELLGGIGLAATRPASCPITHPTYCNWRNSIGGSHEFVLDVQDYAGEITRNMTAESLTRQRLLDCDGLIIFVDPTRPFDEYLTTLRRLFSDLQARRAKKVGQPVHVPVALVVPKIDLLDRTNDCGNPAAQADRLLGDLRQSRPIDEGTTLRAIEHRSDLIGELVRDVVPLAQIRSMVEAVVGRGCVMTFPVATLGWHESPKEHLASVGPKAHEYLVQNSFGVLDPVLWLLHRLGMRRLPA